MTSPERSRIDESILSETLPLASEAVLLRCRDTIRRLHSEIEEERCRRRELQQELHAAQADVRHLQVELDRERERLAESSMAANEAKTARREALRLEERLAETERSLSAAEGSQEGLRAQVQQARAEAAHRAEALISSEVKVTELENALRRTENRSLSLEEEAASCSARLAASAGKVADMERELTALRSAAELEAERAQHSGRLAEEHRRRSELAQHDVETAQAASHSSARLAQEAQEELLKVRDELTKVQREKDFALSAAATANAHNRDVDASLATTKTAFEQSSVECQALQRRVTELEHTCRQAESQEEAVRAKVSEELDETREQLGSKDVELATALAEGDAVRQQVKRLLDRQLELEGRSQDAETKRDEFQLLIEKGKKQFNDEMAAATAKLRGQLEQCQSTETEAVQRVERLEAQWQLERQALLESATQSAVESAAKSAVLMADERSGLERRNMELLEELRQKQKQERGGSAQLRWQQAELERRLEAATSEFRVEQRRAREAQAAVQELKDALRSSDGELEAYEEIVEKLRQSYERKLAKLHHQLAERESYENRLKSLLDQEVDVLHQYNQELADFPTWSEGQWRL